MTEPRIPTHRIIANTTGNHYVRLDAEVWIIEHDPKATELHYLVGWNDEDCGEMQQWVSKDDLGTIAAKTDGARIKRPNHYSKLHDLFKQATPKPDRALNVFLTFAIEYLCNELSISDEQALHLGRRVAALEGIIHRLEPASDSTPRADRSASDLLEDSTPVEIYKSIEQGNGRKAWQLFERAQAAERNKALEDAAKLIEPHPNQPISDYTEVAIEHARLAGRIRALKTTEHA